MRPLSRVLRLCSPLSAFGFVVALVAGFAANVSAQSTTAGPPLTVGTNVNMVGGPAGLSFRPSDLKIEKIDGDPYLQRQNEPSMACSSRNPVNCLASANDYRLVGTPGVADGKVTGDAWLGVYWSHDEGQTWRSTLLPGFPLDASPAGVASPIAGAGASADPTVRAGTNGLFYVSGVAFNRDAESTGVGGKAGKMFVATFIDDNNTQAPDSPIRYISTVVVDGGSSGQFLDKPWIATDIPRGRAGTCTIPASNGVAQQTVPAGNVYVAYSVFLGSGNNVHSKLLFTRSTDCGKTWDTPQKLNESYQEISQSALISINPTNGAVMVAWRQFGDANNSDPGRILVAQSTDFGKTFGKTVTVAALGLSNASVAYDQPSLPVPGDLNPDKRMFRTNGFPTACIGTDGVYRVAWAQRWNTGNPDLWPSRILLSTSTDGQTWTAPSPIDNSGGLSHQFMPSMACTANRATMLWYDQRNDVQRTAVIGYFIFDFIPPGTVHALDVRAAQSQPTNPAAFLPSVQVSRYQWALVPGKSPVQLQYNSVNWPLYAKGTTPFVGDYIDLAPARIFKAPPDGTANGVWTYNTDADDAGVIHAVWTDNRDIMNRAETWGVWAPPGVDGCVADAAEASKRNQNIYTARLSRGLVVGVEGNSRLVPDVATKSRAFVVFVQNATTKGRKFRLTISGAAGSRATFDRSTLPSASNPTGTAPLGFLDAVIAPLSSVARTVFVPAAEVTPVVVNVVELNGPTNNGDGLRGSAVINADATAPPATDTSIYLAELYSATISTGKVVVDYTNPVYYPDPTAPTPTYIDQTVVNPTYIDPTYIDPTYIDPTYIDTPPDSPTLLNRQRVTTVTWQVTNSGNVAAGFNVSALSAELPADAVTQLVITRLYPTPGVTKNCTVGQQYSADIHAVINNPVLSQAAPGNPLSPDVTNATFALAAGEKAVLTLRVAHDMPFDGRTASLATAAQAADPTATGSPVVLSAPSIFVPPNRLQTVEATGLKTLVTYDPPVTAVDALGAPVVPNCSPASGTLFELGTTKVVCSATDSRGTTASTSFGVAVGDTTAPSVSSPGNLTAAATGRTGAVVTFTVTATDSVDGALSATCVPASGSTFVIGTTTVSCTATDAAKNTGSATFTVTVSDTAAPTVAIVPGSLVLEATGPTGAVGSFAASASDLVDGVMTPTCSATSPRTFAIGTTTVVCSATDTAGNTGSASLTVTVRDTTAPVLALPAPITTEATSASGATVTYIASGTDIVDLAVPAVCRPASGSTFPIAVTTVTCTATDRAGNTRTGTFTVTVKDSTAPIVVEAATPATLLWSPNKTMTPVTVSGKVTDISRIASVTYSVWDEYGKVQPSGSLTLNADGTYSLTVKLEAWRQGTDANGRQYIITVTATDAYGNKGTATTQVWVPHN